MSDASNKKLDDVEIKKKWRRRAIIAGIVLGLLCKSLPRDYQAPCRAIANLCTGNIDFSSAFNQTEGTDQP